MCIHVFENFILSAFFHLSFCSCKSHIIECVLLIDFYSCKAHTCLPMLGATLNVFVRITIWHNEIWYSFVYKMNLTVLMLWVINSWIINENNCSCICKCIYFILGNFYIANKDIVNHWKKYFLQQLKNKKQMLDENVYFVRETLMYIYYLMHRIHYFLYDT